MKVQVLSAIMSYGKSTSAIKMISSEPDNFYFVMLPYLDEVKRYQCEEKGANQYLPEGNKLVEPCDEKTTKSQDLLNILKQRQGSVVTTHAMFENLTQEHFNSIKNLPMRRGEKVLVLDETIDLVKPVNDNRLSSKALQADVENEYIIVNEDTGKVQWNSCKEFEGNQGAYHHHEHLKNLCDTGMLYFIEGRYVVMEVSINFLECFDRVLVLTYRWESSIMANYLKVQGVDAEILDLDEDRVLDIYKYIADHLVIPDDYSIEEYRLSKEGMKNNVGPIRSEINKHIKQAMKDYEIGLDETLFTTFKNPDGESTIDWLKTVKIGEYTKLDSQGKEVPACFLSHTTLGTNEYRHCRLMVYGLDKRIQPAVQSYFSRNGSSMPAAEWELSSLIQWLFRGCIRDQQSGKEMIAVILCPRMRKMAQDWLEGIKRQVREGKVAKASEAITIDSKTRRTKMQQFNKWKKNNPGGEAYSFDDYLIYGGPKLKRMLKEAA
ncbi:hypothetical protein [Halomonas litopenaei]|uniref:hypothetical protein n=1 Tax=Halomonas litopenaei TaxID=2109328 RepID=UPI003FA07983